MIDEDTPAAPMPPTDDEAGATASQQPDLRKKKKGADEETAQLLSTVNRQLPCSLESEQGLLSCLIQDPADLVSITRSMLPPEAFYFGTTRVVYAALLAMEEKGLPIEVTSVCHYLKERGELDRAGGHSAISELWTQIAMPGTDAYYRKTVRTKWMLRTLIHKLSANIHLAFDHGKDDPEMDATPTITNAEQDVFSVLESSQAGEGTGMQVITATEAGGQWVTAFETICNYKGRIPGISTGYIDIDRMFHGLAVDADGDLWLCGGFPGMGKTGMGISLLENICIDQQNPTLVFPLEMGHIGWQHRLILGRAEVNVAVSRNGFASKEDTAGLRDGDGQAGKDDQGAIARALSEVQKSPLFWDTSSSIEIDDLCARVTMHVRKSKVKCVIIDHFGQIQPSTPEGRKDERLGQKEIMFKLHKLRRRHGILIILFVQLDKAAREKQNQNRPPNNGDIRGASEMVEYPTQISFIHRPDEVFKWPMLFNEDEKKNRQEHWERICNDFIHDFPDAWHDGRNLPAGVSVAQRNYEEHARHIITKNRNGATCDDICLRYRKEYQRFIGRTLKLYSNNNKFRQVKLQGF